MFLFHMFLHALDLRFFYGLRPLTMGENSNRQWLEFRQNYVKLLFLLATKIDCTVALQSYSVQDKHRAIYRVLPKSLLAQYMNNPNL